MWVLLCGLNAERTSGYWLYPGFTESKKKKPEIYSYSKRIVGGLEIVLLLIIKIDNFIHMSCVLLEDVEICRVQVHL